MNSLIKKEMKETTYDQHNVASSFQNLQKTVTKAAKETLPIRKPTPIRKRKVSEHTKKLYADRANEFERMTATQRKEADRAIRDSCRNDYRDYITSIVEEMEAADRVGNTRAISKLVNVLAKKRSPNIMPAKDHNGNLITSSEQLLQAWNSFLEKKFASPASDEGKAREATVPPEDYLSDEELDKALFAMKPGRAPGWDQVPAELYQNSETACA